MRKPINDKIYSAILHSLNDHNNRVHYSEIATEAILNDLRKSMDVTFDVFKNMFDRLYANNHLDSDGYDRAVKAVSNFRHTVKVKLT